MWIWLLTVFFPPGTHHNACHKVYIRAEEFSHVLRCGLVVYTCLPCALLAPPPQVRGPCVAPLSPCLEQLGLLHISSSPAPDSKPPGPGVSQHILQASQRTDPSLWPLPHLPGTLDLVQCEELTVPWRYFIGVFNITFGGPLFKFPLLRFPPFFSLCAQSVSVYFISPGWYTQYTQVFL